jgi:hypothetical protein
MTGVNLAFAWKLKQLLQSLSAARWVIGSWLPAQHSHQKSPKRLKRPDIDRLTVQVQNPLTWMIETNTEFKGENE